MEPACGSRKPSLSGTPTLISATVRSKSVLARYTATTRFPSVATCSACCCDICAVRNAARSQRESTLLDAHRPATNVPHAEANFWTPSESYGHLPAEQLVAPRLQDLRHTFAVHSIAGWSQARLVLREDAAHAYGLHGKCSRQGIPQILRIDSFPISGAIGLLGRSDYST
jgi:hypothetical protein